MGLIACWIGRGRVSIEVPRSQRGFRGLLSCVVLCIVEAFNRQGKSSVGFLKDSVVAMEQTGPGTQVWVLVPCVVLYLLVLIALYVMDMHLLPANRQNVAMSS